MGIIGRPTHWRLSGSEIPDTGGVHHWWSAYIPATYPPDHIRLTIAGGPDTDARFVAGRTWGFRVAIKRKGKNEWENALWGGDTLADAGFTSGPDQKAVAVADFTIPLVTNAEDWLEYFRPYGVDSFEVRIEGAPLNHPPVAVAQASPSPATTNALVTLDGSGSTDPDGDMLVYIWEQVMAAGRDPLADRVVLSNPYTANPTFTAPADPTTLSFTLTVTDSGGMSASDTVDVVVTRAAVPTAPGRRLPRT